ncbi:ribose ABC transporter, ATP-binding protein, partial [Pseudomonas syringae pv. actinidiae ICMP 19096]
AEGGAAVVVLSSDLPELIGITHRIVVLHRGRIAGEFASRATDSDQLLACATGASESDEQVEPIIKEARHVRA